MAGSAGALQVVLAQLQRLTFRSDGALFIVYHRQSNPAFRLEDLAGPCQMTVRAADPGERVQANFVHYPRDSSDLAVLDGRLVVSLPATRHHPNIDRLLASLAKAYGPKVLAVLLSGMATDGLQGLKDVRAAGGRTLVQDPASAKFPQLPDAAVAAGLGEVVGIAEMQRLIEQALGGTHPSVIGSTDPLRPLR